MYIELLAPAKNFEFGKAAINHGADAIYIGAPSFGARKQASNSIEEIEKIIKYAHLFRSKVYVALNTLLFDQELEQAEKIICQLYNIGTDALIIQDFGILEMNIPPIEIHSSTQMHNIDVEKISFLEKVGIKRAILARELSIDEIKTIRNATTIELESFIHGALCVSYSGQCYISHALNGRSGNRGECAQICRTSFSLKDNNGKCLIKDKHLLSLKDLNASSSIYDLANAGISSFKIEGRLKDISYVKNVTAHYRMLLDDVIEKKHLKKSSSGIFTIPFKPDVEASFSRQFTSYFLDGKKKSMASFDTPKAIGKKIGVLIEISQKTLVISGETPIHNSDGLCYFDKKGNLCGFKVNKVENDRITPHEFPQGITIGTELFRNNDIEFERQMASSTETRKIGIKMNLSETDTGVMLSITDEDSLSVDLNYFLHKEISNNPQKILETIYTQLRKTGNSPFVVTECKINIETPLFIKISEINELRRQALDLLENKRTTVFMPKDVIFEKNNVPFPKGNVNYSANITNKKAREFYIRHGVEMIEDGFELQSDFAGKQVMTTRYCVLNELGICTKHQKDKHLLPIFPLWLEGNNHTFRLNFDCKRCQMEIFY